ncbi:MAG: Rha family transcriptional regulator [Sporolactobacillus sp.]|jgi:phage regulator Rha-like protein|nr:Rha family transcriptional regulator [Sporolactobacillus sp.]
MIVHYVSEPTLDSREVAEMVGNKHKELLRKVDGYIQILESAKLRSQDFFIEQSYKTEGNNKTYKRFDITKMGCEMVANKLTGRKGILTNAKLRSLDYFNLPKIGGVSNLTLL